MHLCFQRMIREIQSSSKWSGQTTILFARFCAVHFFATKSNCFYDFLSPARRVLIDKV